MIKINLFGFLKTRTQVDECYNKAVSAFDEATAELDKHPAVIAAGLSTNSIPSTNGVKTTFAQVEKIHEKAVRVMEQTKLFAGIVTHTEAKTNTIQQGVQHGRKAI